MLIELYHVLAHLLEALVTILEVADVGLGGVVQEKVYHDIVIGHLILHQLHLINHLILKSLEIHLYLLVPNLIQPQVALHLIHSICAPYIIIGGLLPVNKLHNLVDACEEIEQLLAYVRYRLYLFDM